MDYMERMRIEFEERLRAKARDDHATDKEQARVNELARIEERESYVLTHGRDGALRKTITKWTIAAAILALLSFLGSTGDVTILKAIKQSALVFLFVTGVGIWRAHSIVNSVR